MPPAIPLSIYRLQLSKDFGFDEAARLVPYLKALGITHLYSSPFLKARAGSQHGYDIVDHTALNPEFGGEEAFARLGAALKEHDVGLILDFVPNHMAVGSSENLLWLDVLEWGQRSPYAAFFDITWELLPYRPGGGLMLPVLGRSYGDALAAGEIELKYDSTHGSFSAWYFDRHFPINPQRYSDILTTVVTAAEASGEPAGKGIIALADDYRRPGTPSYENAPMFKQRLAAIEGANDVVERGLKAYRADHEAGINLLHRLLERQHYRLAFWRLAPSGINYRRFFDVNELAGIRVEDTRTFREIHKLVAKLIETGQLHGLRLDHIDGLFDPLQYTRRLQQLVRPLRGSKRDSFYVTIEKIMADGEELPAFTGIAGTTGYEWLNVISRVLVNESGRTALENLWRNLSPELGRFDTVLDRSKLRVLRTIMASEFNVLSQLLARIAAGHFTTRDYGPDRLRDALTLYVLEFPVYRTYVTAAGSSESDRKVIDRTIAAARTRWHGTDVDIFDFLESVVTLDLARTNLPYSRTRLRQFALKLQQFTGAMMAKSLEDTAFYRYQSLIALNEVGGEPTLPGLSAEDFHRRIADRARRFGHGLTTTATHDTKRGEDARARILSLSEIPGRWEEHVTLWGRLNARFVAQPEDDRSPSIGHEYLLYQTLIGAWPNEPFDHQFVKRIEAYIIKAAREGKLETSWINPNEVYENGLIEFVRRILDRSSSGEFLDSLGALARRTSLLGALNSLTQVLLKATMPGVPDFYQGTEFWDLSLVDPDNRRPVDFLERQSALMEHRDWGDLASRWPDGRIKLALTRRLLELRREHPALFTYGSYEPVDVTGADRDHIIAFMRSHQGRRILVAAGRHFASSTDHGLSWPNIQWDARLDLDRWQGTTWRDALGCVGTDGELPDARRLFQTLPVAVLSSE